MGEALQSSNSGTWYLHTLMCTYIHTHKENKKKRKTSQTKQRNKQIKINMWSTIAKRDEYLWRKNIAKQEKVRQRVKFGCKQIERIKAIHLFLRWKRKTLKVKEFILMLKRNNMRKVFVALKQQLMSGIMITRGVLNSVNMWPEACFCDPISDDINAEKCLQIMKRPTCLGRHHDTAPCSLKYKLDWAWKEYCDVGECLSVTAKKIQRMVRRYQVWKRLGNVSGVKLRWYAMRPEYYYIYKIKILLEEHFLVPGLWSIVESFVDFKEFIKESRIAKARSECRKEGEQHKP